MLFVTGLAVCFGLSDCVVVFAWLDLVWDVLWCIGWLRMFFGVLLVTLVAVWCFLLGLVVGAGF